MKSKIIIFIMLLVFGFILATLGLISFPVFNNINYFWPAAVIQAVGAILFGWIGVVAGTIFPIFSNLATDTSYVSVLCFIPSNFVQSFLPYYLSRKCMPELKIEGIKGALCFCLIAGIIPQLCGGLIASLILLLLNRITTGSEFSKMVLLWFLDSVPWIIVFGMPIIKILSPLLREYGYLYGLRANFQKISIVRNYGK